MIPLATPKTAIFQAGLLPPLGVLGVVLYGPWLQKLTQHNQTKAEDDARSDNWKAADAALRCLTWFDLLVWLRSAACSFLDPTGSSLSSSCRYEPSGS